VPVCAIVTAQRIAAKTPSDAAFRVYTPGFALTQAVFRVDSFCSAVPAQFLVPRRGSTEPASRLPVLTQWRQHEIQNSDVHHRITFLTGNAGLGGRVIRKRWFKQLA